MLGQNLRKNQLGEDVWENQLGQNLQEDQLSQLKEGEAIQEGEHEDHEEGARTIQMELVLSPLSANPL